MRPLLIATTLLLSLMTSVVICGPAQAQSEGDRAESLLRLLRKRPRKMNVDTWREQRREAVRELGRLKEKRALPMLLKIIGKERFDVILEIAIDSLGNIGDQRAIGPLRDLLDDPSLDAYVRDAAAGALRKLEGTKRTPRPTTPTPRTRPASPRTPPTPATPKPAQPEGRKGSFARLAPLKLDKLRHDLIASTSRLDLLAGAGHFRWDGNAKQTDAAFAVSGRYYRQVERKKLGYSLDGAADVSFSLIDPADQDATWSLGSDLQFNPEIRYYPFTRDVPLLFGQVSGGVGYGLRFAQLPAAPDKRVGFAATVTAAGGPGYGRVFDIGPRLRLKRLAWVLRKAGVLSQKLDPVVGRKVLQAWYQLRDRIGSFERLGYTLRILREANVLESEELADPATVYRMVRILDDPQLDDRPAGIMLRAGYGYARALVKDADDQTLAFVYATAALHRQPSTSKALGAELRFFYNMWGTPDTFNAQLTGNFDHYLYNRAFDPLGALSLSVTLGLNNGPGAALEDGGLAYTALGGVGYSRYFTRGSRFTAALRGGLENNGAVLLLSLEARYGIARGTFVTAP